MFLISCWLTHGESITFMPQSFSRTVVCVVGCCPQGYASTCSDIHACGLVARLEGELNDIDALKDLKQELISQKEVG